MNLGQRADQQGNHRTPGLHAVDIPSDSPDHETIPSAVPYFKLLGDGIWFAIVGHRVIADGNIEPGEEQGPWHFKFWSLSVSLEIVNILVSQSDVD